MYTETQHVPLPHNPHYNTHSLQPQNPPHTHNPPTQHRTQAHPNTKEPFVALAIPAVTITDHGVHYGNAQSTSTRSFTPLKAIGDGSFGTVWLCDWHGPLPPNTPLSAMQSGAGARPEYATKRLVAVKRMKKKWEGGWEECKRLKELEALRAIPMHPNIIPLYDSFLLPESKELYFVFEPMEGHLFQLIKARKGRPLAGGLVASIFRQIVLGLHHIHLSGYFHRDLKPENVLVTTTGLHDYPNISPVALPGAPPERDVEVIIKLADFGLARETKSKPPYTEYVSTRWYRAPEVLLKSRDYSNPVDMWALGTIMAELVNLRPLFPGKGELDQINKITEILGDPTEDYGLDARGKSFGGGMWSKGIKLAKNVGFTFPRTAPHDITMMFDRSVPRRLIECIADLLKYEPAARLTSRQCMEHPYIQETTSRPLLSVSTSGAPSNSTDNVSSVSGASPRLAPSHSHTNGQYNSQIPDVSSSHRQSFYEGDYTSEPQYAHARRLSDNMPLYPPQLQHSTTVSSVSSYQSVASPQVPGDWDPMNVSPHAEVHEDYIVGGQPMDIMTSPMAQEYPSRPAMEPDPMQEQAVHDMSSSGTKFGKLPSLSFKKQHKWSGLGGMFGHGDKGQHGILPPVDEMHVASSSSTPSLKRTQSSSTTDSRSLPEVQPPITLERAPPKDPKKIKKEAERMAREAEKQRRAQMEKSHREQARAVMEKRNQVLMQSHTRGQLEWKWQTHGDLLTTSDTHRTYAESGKSAGNGASSNAGGGGAGPIRQKSSSGNGWRRDERMAKARRREFDDDHSMSSSDVQSISQMSAISFATIDSDPGPSGLRHRPSMLGVRVPTTSSSLRQYDEYSMSARSSNSLSLEQQLVNDFHMQASVDAVEMSHSDAGSPPPMHALSLSPSHSWQTLHPHSDGPDVTMRQPQPTRLNIPLQHSSQPYGGRANGFSPSPGMDAPKSAINPIFKVPSLPSLTRTPGSLDRSPSTPSLPPFSQLEAIAKGECPPLSPMSFTKPDEDF
ncbi:Pkinase-domain-containing protein [Artomyces pyxidatus]|uniref:Pkinase-domain-containing protein n=1 Tax=Artomyces pyxidatus TaxID=48021 RepID=A0ACB8TIG5_9AGAM|nr:Pkinase-domain-containing protein [Artomyces pyxidatus]